MPRSNRCRKMAWWSSRAVWFGADEGQKGVQIAQTRKSRETLARSPIVAQHRDRSGDFDGLLVRPAAHADSGQNGNRELLDGNWFSQNRSATVWGRMSSAVAD